MSKKYIDTNEAAAILGVSRSLMRQFICYKQVEVGPKFGAANQVLKASVLALRKSRQERAALLRRDPVNLRRREAVLPPSVARWPSLRYLERESLPDCPAVYAVVACSDVLYVGVSRSLVRRFASHTMRHYFDKVGDIVSVVWNSDVGYDQELEKELIRSLAPVLNDHHMGENRMPEAATRFQRWCKKRKLDNGSIRRGRPKLNGKKGKKRR